jgi:tetratricopeptide (TPR) repeat protein
MMLKWRLVAKLRLQCLAIVVYAILGCAGRMSAQPAELASAINLIHGGQLQLAEKKLQRVVARQPHSARAFHLLSVVYMREHRYDEAEQALLRALQEDPKLIDSFRTLGEVYIAEGKPKLAAAAYEDALKLVPADADSNLALAALYQDAGEYQQSLDAAARVAPARRTSALLPILAADYVGLNEHEKAELEIRAMLNVAAKNPELVPQFAGFLLERGAIGDADELLKTAANLQKRTDKFLYQSARVQALQGNHAEARQMLAELVERSPAFLDAVAEAGRLAGLDSDWKQAAILLYHASQLAPQRIDILQGLVTAQLDSHQFAAALRTSQKLVALQPGDLRSSYFLALAQAGNQQWPEAKSSAEKVLEAHPEDREMNITLAAVAYNMNDITEARKRVERCLKQNRSDAGALYFLGLIQKAEGDSKAAIETLASSIVVDPNNAEAQSALGGLYLQEGDLPHARAALEKAAQLWPESADNHYKLALVYTRSGLSEQAKEQLEIYKKQMEALAAPPTSHTMQMMQKQP